jgi:transglutaminase-like putative cysteine protease
MLRTVTTHLTATVSGPATIEFSVAAAADSCIDKEQLSLSVDGVAVEPTEVVGPHGTRFHTLVTQGGEVVLDYSASVSGQARPLPVEPIDRITYLRPSRYCESDTLGPTAMSEFAGLSGTALLEAVVDWVSERLVYVTGSSRPTDGAVATLLARQGVCRDFAHLSIALLRALGVPARLAAVYAPGLSPMEFHAVAEAQIQDAWYVVDATKLAPRQTLLRVATGRDAADTAFLTNNGAALTLGELEVTAVADEFETENGDFRLVELR